MSDRAATYATWIIILALVSLVCVVGIVLAEVFSTRAPGLRQMAGVFIGIILLAYSFILLFLRKGGFTGV
jgi:hypothetical protein